MRTKRRENNISWDEYFMGVALLSGERSKDPGTQVGACIVSPNNIILGIGYNGAPRGINDDEIPWDREGSFAETKYPYVVHAEMNAILNSTVDLTGSRIYVGLFPCNECAKAIIQKGIKEVVYLSDKHKENDIYKVSRRLLDEAGVKCRHADFGNKEIVLKFY